MKCPQCSVRNSVAATQCKDCGTKFPKKGIAGTGIKLPGRTSERLKTIDDMPSPAAAPNPSLATGSNPSLATGSNPSLSTGANSIANRSMVTGSNPSLATGSNPSLTTGANPSLSTGANPSLSTGANPSLSTGAQPQPTPADLGFDFANEPQVTPRAFPRKPLPKKLILGALGIAAVFGIGVAAFSIVPAVFDSEASLKKIAKRVADGPKNGADAVHIKAELESTTKDFLEKNVKLSTQELQVKMQNIFPNAVFEVRIFDLPNALRLVEIDTMILPTDYLMTSKHATVMRNFEVYDSAKVVSDGTGQCITLLGHRNAQAGHKPQVAVYALLPDGVADRTAESVPALSGDGNAAFAANGKDINLELSMMSKASEERLFTVETLAKGTVPDETVKSRLTFKGGKYELSEDMGKGPMAALRAAAFVLADGSAKDRFRRYFGSGTMGSISSMSKLKVTPPMFTLKKIGGGAVATASAPAPAASSNSNDDEDNSRRGRRHRRHRRHHRDNDSGQSHSSSNNGGGGGGTLTYLLNNSQDAFEVALSRGDGRYFISSIKQVKASSENGAAAVVTAPAQQDNVLKAADAVLNDKVVVKGEDLQKAAEAAEKDKRDKQKVAMTAPQTPDSSGETESHKMITPKVVEKKADAESGTISSALSTPTIKVRRGASTGYRSVGELKRGADIQIIGKKDGWYKVQLDGREGYVYGGFVDCKTSDAYTTATVRRGKGVKDKNGNTIGEAQSGDRLVVVGPVTNDKYKVQLSSGRTGYLDKDAIDVTADAPQFVP